jgi:hypothetical protein
MRLRLALAAALCLAFAPTSARAEPAEDAATALGWRPGDPVPTGYRFVKPRLGRTLALIGAGTFIAAYLPPLALGMVSVDVRLLGLVQPYFRGGDTEYGPPEVQLIPIAGPFVYVALHNTDPGLTSGWRAFYLADGAGQAAGAVVAVVGAMLDAGTKPRLVRDDPAELQIRVQPTIDQRAMGLALVGSF